MLGEIKLAKFTSLTEMPQKAASAWAAVEELVGANYVPLLYVGTQQVRGTNHWFIAEQTFITALPERHLVKLAVNEFNGSFAVVPHSIEVIAG